MHKILLTRRLNLGAYTFIPTPLSPVRLGRDSMQHHGKITHYQFYFTLLIKNCRLNKLLAKSLSGHVVSSIKKKK